MMPDGGTARPLIDTQAEFPPPADAGGEARTRRGDLHKLRRVSGRIVGGRQHRCGIKPTLGSVTVYRTQGEGGPKAQYGGIETCGSVWTCPVCAPKITEGRREEIATVLRLHREAGGAAYLATFSIPHHLRQSCARTKQVVANAWRKLVSGKPWLRIGGRFGIEGWTRALEITHGRNGWHPHIHALIFTAAPLHATELQAIRFELFDRWQRIIKRMGQGLCSMLAFDLRPADAGDGAADYVGKWGADAEMTKAHIKRNGKGGRTPWSILRDFAATGDLADAELFAEYARAFKGARQLTWSKGFRDRYLEPERSDDELAAEITAQPADAVAVIPNPVWRDIALGGHTAAVLDAAETGGLSAIVALLDRLGVISDGITTPPPKPPDGGARSSHPAGAGREHV